MMHMQAALPSTSDELPWTRAAFEVNAWRGACLQAFSRAEAAVTETLLSLSGTGGSVASVQLRHLVGQRLEDLAQALEREAAFEGEAMAAREALASFRTFEKLRAHLAHGVARVALERNGSWVVLLLHIAIRQRAAERSTVAFDQAEAAEALNDLERNTQRLDSALADLRRAVAVGSPLR
jgi:hypothetical protein